jgi:CRISPR-associated protein Csb2
MAQMQAAIDGLGLATGKKLTQAQQKRLDAIGASYPSDLVDCLQRDTAWWKGEKWSRAPGSRSVLYWREANALEVGPASRPRARGERRVEMMLLALTTPSGSKSALPTVARTLPQAERLHRALVKQLGVGGEHCPELVGRNEGGAPLVGHQHAHLLPLDLDDDGHIDHVVIYAPMGLGARAQQAARRLRATYMKGGVGELQVAVAGVGALSDLRSIDADHARAVARLLGPTKGAQHWMSTTPFVPPRHIKPRGRSSLVGQIEAELNSRGFPRAKVEVLELTAERLALRHFVRRRSRGPQPPVDVGLAIRLEFEEPVRGPIALGYGSHFGLGLFAAVE